MSSVDTDVEEVDWNTTDDKGDGGSDTTDHMKRQSTRSSAAKGQQNIANWVKTLLSPAPEDVN